MTPVLLEARMDDGPRLAFLYPPDVVVTGPTVPCRWRGREVHLTPAELDAMGLECVNDPRAAPPPYWRRT